MSATSVHLRRVPLSLTNEFHCTINSESRPDASRLPPQRMVSTKATLPTFTVRRHDIRSPYTVFAHHLSSFVVAYSQNACYKICKYPGGGHYGDAVFVLPCIEIADTGRCARHGRGGVLRGP